MAVKYEQDGISLVLGDMREVLADMPMESVSCVITSPPWWGLRRYESPPSIWGSNHGDSWCGIFGAEPRVEMYINHTMECLRAIKRVLRPDGIVFWDIGDSRSGSGGAHAEHHANPGISNSWERKGVPHYGQDGIPERYLPKEAPATSLMLIPERISLAALHDGWVVRSIVVIPAWMPESAKARPTDAYRNVIILSKNNKTLYWWNDKTFRCVGEQPKSREEGIDWDYERNGGELVIRHNKSIKRSHWHGESVWWDWWAVREPAKTKETAKRKFSGPRNKWTDNTQSRTTAGLHESGRDPQSYQSGNGYRNLGNIWSIPPANYSSPVGQHFAVFHLNEATLAIKAACPEAICTTCGKPRFRVTRKEQIREHPLREGRQDRNKGDYDGSGYAVRDSGLGLVWDAVTAGWTECGCGAPLEPGLVLDPFAGTGTTPLAARALGRRCVGIDTSENYLVQAVARLTKGDKELRRRSRHDLGVS